MTTSGWPAGYADAAVDVAVKDGPVIKIQVDVVKDEDDDDNDDDDVQVHDVVQEEDEDDEVAAEDDDDAVDAAGLTQLSDVDSSTTIPIYSSDTDGIPSYTPLTIRSNGG